MREAKEVEMLEKFVRARIPTTTIREGEDWDRVLAEGFKVSKRQIREWRQTKALRVKVQASAYVVLAVGKTLQNLLLVIKVRDVHEKA
jgi:hypothetical protein